MSTRHSGLADHIVEYLTVEELGRFARGRNAEARHVAD
jgi:hypothetical protein